MWLLRAYLEKFKFWAMLMLAMIMAGLIAHPVGTYLGNRWNVDEELPIAGCFIIVLVVGAVAYERLQRWWFFRSRRP